MRLQTLGRLPIVVSADAAEDSESSVHSPLCTFTVDPTASTSPPALTSPFALDADFVVAVSAGAESLFSVHLNTRFLTQRTLELGEADVVLSPALAAQPALARSTLNTSTNSATLHLTLTFSSLFPASGA